MPAEPPPLPARRSAGTHAVWISALVYPGAGQWLQGRKTAACLVLVPTTLVFLAIIGLLVWPVLINFCCLFELAGKSADDVMLLDDIFALLQSAPALWLYGSLGLLYMAGVMDAWLAYRRGQP